MSELSDYHKLVKSLTKEDILSRFSSVTPLAASKYEFSSTSSSSSNTASGSESAPVSSSASANSSSSDTLFSGHDEEQIKLMDENCIVLDYNDTPLGAGTKKLCHIMDNINQGLLHRAFSVFLFNSNNELLLQQRADEKITFPSMWTNTCCSHPLCVKTEVGVDFTTQESNLDLAIKGAQSAAQRKLFQELGIPAEDVPKEDFKFLTRIHYMAPSDGLWGEHEIDYILIIKANPSVNVNPNEVKDYKYVSAEKLKEMFEDPELVFTPWFKLICESYLFKWWDHIDSLEEFKSDKIDRML
ncbi:hypothetical protein CANARDRAFT_197247 [[Candida] arabinofermentans NRRL YB-2248]|uniref:Isopentenyl-diphosphate Delta-isomerase n=1 Tax=[Candida] arabinofermentans NRRL YB-2248 TaxID=983967 RepID=A0A1E4T3D5_9ASCO|nr:hypothetical protein CANARDRAFT_197247 [[Candida] arabinofermentans NRRL YB-2248]